MNCSFNLVEKLKDVILSFFYKRRMKKCGHNVSIRPSSSIYYGLENLSIGDNVSIPRYSHIFCTDAPLIIGSNVLFGPAPTIVTGDHRIDKIGVPIFSSFEKLPENDLQVIICDDVWIGANVTILKGVTIGRGCVVAAGSVVNKSLTPYTISGGVPCHFIKCRFSIDQIIEHEKMIYLKEDRYTKEELEMIFSNII